MDGRGRAWIVDGGRGLGWGCRWLVRLGRWGGAGVAPGETLQKALLSYSNRDRASNLPGCVLGSN